jgi:UDPglucose--hexose-1-phosphate uridylyltransferase
MAVNQLRKDPITGRWTITIMDKFDLEELIKYQTPKIIDTQKCLYCEGNENKTPPEILALRQKGHNQNEMGWRIRVVPDKKPVLHIYGDINNRGLGIYDILDGVGAHEIVIETPRHNETIVDLDEDHIAEIYWTFKERILDLKEDSRFRYVLVLKNSGVGFNDTSRHSTSIILASPITPKRVKDELVYAREYYSYKERCIFCDIIRQELHDNDRIILEDGKFVALAPFASQRPFEVWILPQKHETFFELTTEYRSLAKLTKELVTRLYKLLNVSDYVMAIHSGPNLKAGRRRGFWQTLEKDFHWHIEIMPRLRLYSTFEASAGFPVNYVPPEQAAMLLKDID